MHNPDNRQEAEIEIMIAFPAYQHCGYGYKCICMMMKYAIKELRIRRFFAKINEKNVPSIQLFKKWVIVYDNCVEMYMRIYISNINILHVWWLIYICVYIL